MGTLMKIDSNHIKKLREAMSWSQEHLSSAAGLSLRTIQRVEAEGSASAETKMAIASAFSVTAEELTPKPLKKRPRYPGVKYGVAFGYAGVAIGTISAYIGIFCGSGTGFDAGVAYGVIGLLSGLSCAAIGVVANYYARAQASV